MRIFVLASQVLGRRRRALRRGLQTRDSRTTKGPEGDEEVERELEIPSGAENSWHNRDGAREQARRSAREERGINQGRRGKRNEVTTTGGLQTTWKMTRVKEVSEEGRRNHDPPADDVGDDSKERRRRRRGMRNRG